MGAHGGENVAVVVEAAAVHLHETHALFHEAAGEQRAAPELGVAVALDGIRFFLIDLEGFQRRAFHQRDRVFQSLLGGLEFRRTDIAGKLRVHPLQHLQAPHPALMADAFGKREIGIFLAGQPDEIRLAALAQITGAGGLAADAHEGG